MLGLNLPVSFDEPAWLWLLLAVPVIVAVSLRTLVALEPSRRAAVIVLRCLVVIALTLALAEIHYVRRSHNVAVMVVIDRSKSIPDGLRGDAKNFMGQLVKAREHNEDRIGLIGFDGRADIDMIPSRPGVNFEQVPFGLSMEPDRTDIAAGIRLAMAAFPEGYARRIVVLTDGNENIGNVKEEIESARANDVSVDVVPLQYQHTNEILFDRIVLPSQASRDTKVPVRMVVKSMRPTKARLRVRHNGRELLSGDDENIIELSGGMKPDRFDISQYLPTGGVHRFEAEIEPLTPGADAIVENNRATGFTFVDEQGRVLILSPQGSAEDRVLLEALQREKLEAEWYNVDQITIDALKLQEYSVVILSNLAADQFTQEQHKGIASYVRDFGGGLIMTGGTDSFGAGGWIGTPVEEISPVSFEIKHKKVIPKGALVIVMHSCEIPRGNYWGEQVAIAAVKAISSLDYLGVICYSYSKGGPNWDVPLAQATNKPAVINAIQNMQIGDMPDFASTMSTAVKDIMALPGVAQRHMIIISDGDPQPPSKATLDLMVKNEITCSTVGIGYGSHVMEAPLRRIANVTKGRFYPVRNPRQLPQIFMKEAKVVKRPLLVDEQFQPLISWAAAPTLAGLGGDVPPLGGLVLTSPKTDAMIPIIRKSTDGDDPVLAHWNVEMGKMVVFTSGMWDSWGADWANWPSFGKFWAQLVRWTMRQGEAANFDVITRLDGNKGKIYIEALNKDEGYLNFLRFDGRVLDPSMEQHPIYLTQTGPGQYEAEFDVKDAGNYLVNLRYNTPDGGTGMLRTGLSMPYSPEFRDLDTNFTLLSQASDRTGGRMLDLQAKAEKIFDKTNLPPHVSRQPIWKDVVMWILLPLFLLDVASRRLASVVAMSIFVEAAVLVVGWALMLRSDAPWWGYLGVLFLAELVGWTIRFRSIVPTLQWFTYGVRASARAERASAESLSHLRGVRDKVRDEIATGEREERKDEHRIPTKADQAPAADPKRRFDAGDAGDEAVGDLTESLGGAKADAPRPKQQRTYKSDEPSEDMTSRLLRAKKRAREDLNKKDEDAD